MQAYNPSSDAIDKENLGATYNQIKSLSPNQLKKSTQAFSKSPDLKNNGSAVQNNLLTESTHVINNTTQGRTWNIVPNPEPIPQQENQSPVKMESSPQQNKVEEEKEMEESPSPQHSKTYNKRQFEPQPDSVFNESKKSKQEDSIQNDGNEIVTIPSNYASEFPRKHSRSFDEQSYVKHKCTKAVPFNFRCEQRGRKVQEQNQKEGFVSLAAQCSNFLSRDSKITSSCSQKPLKKNVRPMSPKFCYQSRKPRPVSTDELTLRDIPKFKPLELNKKIFEPVQTMIPKKPLQEPLFEEFNLSKTNRINNNKLSSDEMLMEQIKSQTFRAKGLNKKILNQPDFVYQKKGDQKTTPAEFRFQTDERLKMSRKISDPTVQELANQFKARKMPEYKAFEIKKTEKQHIEFKEFNLATQERGRLKVKANLEFTDQKPAFKARKVPRSVSNHQALEIPHLPPTSPMPFQFRTDQRTSDWHSRTMGEFDSIQVNLFQPREVPQTHYQPQKITIEPHKPTEAKERLLNSTLRAQQREKNLQDINQKKEEKKKKQEEEKIMREKKEKEQDSKARKFKARKIMKGKAMSVKKSSAELTTPKSPYSHIQARYDPNYIKRRHEFYDFSDIKEESANKYEETPHPNTGEYLPALSPPNLFSHQNVPQAAEANIFKSNSQNQNSMLTDIFAQNEKNEGENFPKEMSPNNQ